MTLEDTGRPLAPDADTARYADGFVDDEQLPVIAWNEAEPAPEAGTIEDLDVDSTARELADE
jgi:hypothetical protein